MNEQLTIRQMCDAYDVTPRTLRFYEAKELIAPQREGQKRLYNKSCQARLTLILKGKRFGFSLEEIRQLLNLYYMGDQQRTQLAQTYAMGLERLDSMKRQRAELDETIIELEEQLEWGAKLVKADEIENAAE